MGSVVGNTVRVTTVNGATSIANTNNGASLDVPSGETKVVRLVGNAKLSGEDTIGKNGLSVNGNGRLFLIQGGDSKIYGGPGNTSNNYGGTGGTGATGLFSNAEVQHLKIGGTVLGGSGGGGGRGKGSIERSVITPSHWTFPAYNNTLYVYKSDGFSRSEVSVWNARNTYNNSFRTNTGGSTLNWSYINNNNNISNGNVVAPTHGNDGNKGTPRSPGQTGNSGNDGNNGNPGNGNIANTTSFSYTITSGSAVSTTSNYRKTNYVNVSIKRANANDFLYFSQTENINFAYNSGNNLNYTLFGKVQNNSTGPFDFLLNNANVIKLIANAPTYNSKVNPISGGAGGNPGNAYNNSNVIKRFG